MISSEGNRQVLRKRLGLEVDQEMPEHFAALLAALDQREQELADEPSVRFRTSN
ncbi:hypothetical protein NKI95_24765 [Mesorhizobium sp. M0306]|uniref:hypothetical protein n=1 Tax=Mesorhizobium sp. M0306 TaxID=2956932 RepID=UPI003339087B